MLSTDASLLSFLWSTSWILFCVTNEICWKSLNKIKICCCTDFVFSCNLSFVYFIVLFCNQRSFNLPIFFPAFHFTGNCRFDRSLLLPRIRWTFRARSELLSIWFEWVIFIKLLVFFLSSYFHCLAQDFDKMNEFVERGQNKGFLWTLARG